MKRKASIVFLALMVGLSSLSLVACNSSSSTTSAATNNFTVTGSDSASGN